MDGATSTRARVDEGWRTQPYLLAEGSYEFEVEAVEGHEGDRQVLRLRVAVGPFEGHRLLVKEAVPIPGLREAIAAGKPCGIRATIMRVQGRGRRLVRASLV
jgi:hypothetical protein